jgi:hypothetical protein
MEIPQGAGPETQSAESDVITTVPSQTPTTHTRVEIRTQPRIESDPEEILPGMSSQ